MFKKLVYYLKQKKYRPHFGEDDIIIEDMILNPVHLLPEGRWLENQEADFWMDDKSDFYLLTLCNSQECTVTLIDNQINHYRNIIIRIPVEEMPGTLEKIIYELKHFPYARKLKNGQQTCPFG